MIENLNFNFDEIEINEEEIENLTNLINESLIETEEFNESVDRLASIIREIRNEK